LTKLTSILIIAIIISATVMISNIQGGNAQTPTQVNGIISQDAAWTKTNSPYNPIRNVLLSNKTTVLVKSRRTMNLYLHYLMIINGSLIEEATA
jgi:hypothetical protein